MFSAAGWLALPSLQAGHSLALLQRHGEGLGIQQLRTTRRGYWSRTRLGCAGLYERAVTAEASGVLGIAAGDTEGIAIENSYNRCTPTHVPDPSCVIRLKSETLGGRRNRLSLHAVARTIQRRQPDGGHDTD